MKLKIFYLLLITLISISCSNDDSSKSDPKLSIEYLKQSSWNGEYIETIKSSKEVYGEYDFGITFYDETKGEYSVYYKDSGSIYEKNYFNYKVNNKLLSISSFDSVIAGEWFLLEQNGNEITLVKNLETGAYTDYIRIRETY